MDLDNMFFENTEDDEGVTQQGATLSGKFICLFLGSVHILKYIFDIYYSVCFAGVSKTEAGISPVTGLVRGVGRRGPDIDWREIERFF